MSDARRWVVKDRRTVFSGGPVKEVNIERVLLPDGTEIADYYQVVLPDYALVFATTIDDRVMLFRQYKHGIGRECIGVPGGALADGENPLDAARRELLEETGYASDVWRDLGSYVTNANQRCNVAHLFLAERCRLVAAPTAPDVEQPELLLVPRSELWNRIALGDIGQAAHLALLALATHPTALGAAT